MSYLSSLELSHNSSSWKQMSICIAFCHIFWNSLKFCKMPRWRHSARQNVWIRWSMENYNLGCSVLQSGQSQSFSYITKNIGRTSLWLRLRSRNTHAAKLLCAALIAWQNQPQMIWLMRTWQSFRREFLENAIWFMVIYVNVNYKWSQMKQHLILAYHLLVC